MLNWILKHVPEVLLVSGILSLFLAVVVAMDMDLFPRLRKVGAVTLYTGFVLCALACLTWALNMLDAGVRQCLA